MSEELAPEEPVQQVEPVPEAEPIQQNDRRSLASSFASGVRKCFEAITPQSPDVRLAFQFPLGAVAIIGAIASLFVAYNIPAHRKVILCVWALVPPMYFWFEFYFLYDKKDPKLEEFKYGQEVSRNIWAGVLAALIALKITGEIQLPDGGKPQPDGADLAKSQNPTPTPPGLVTAVTPISGVPAPISPAPVSPPSVTPLPDQGLPVRPPAGAELTPVQREKQ